MKRVEDKIAILCRFPRVIFLKVEFDGHSLPPFNRLIHIEFSDRYDIRELCRPIQLFFPDTIIFTTAKSSIVSRAIKIQGLERSP